MTFSIAGRCAQTHMFGVAIASSSPAVAARCAHARAGVGAVATQNITDPALGPRTLDSLARALGADRALQETLRSTAFGAYRQLVVMGAHGPPAVHTGRHALGLAASAVGSDSAAAGNLLAHAEVPAAMVSAFEAAGGHLGARLLQALRAGAARGGEAGPIHSAGLLVVREVSWPIVDLRVDWSDRDPLGALSAAWEIYAPQIDDYVRRALDPGAAPSFGVPGNL
ncbi:MAG TPA: DUF1028 domain-containing protein [Steroidobacteraceae bacterium]|jgi:uncharacterized Ntn-hydrolase superfamily protein|nr:DUF1028 domain-containing protein [Steroidobacteraceae bacterium]